MNNTPNQGRLTSDTVITDEMSIDPDDELLVAYLDNELSRSDRVQVENRLVDEPELRNRLSDLESGWELLAEIPDESTNRSLVESTLEMAVADFGKPLVSSKPQRRVSWLAKTVVACIAACLASYGLHVWKQRSDYHRQLEDMAIAQDLDAYARGSDIELLRQLSGNTDWTRMTTTVRELAVAPGEPVSLRKTAISDRPSILETMELDDRMKLQSRWGRFERLEEAYREEIRKSAAAINIQPDCETLIATAKAYAVWREQLDEEMVAKIESGDPAMRRNAIESALEQSRTDIARLLRLQLDEEATERIYFVLMEAFDHRTKRYEKLNRFIKSFKIRDRHDRDAKAHDFRWRIIEQVFSSQPKKINIPRSIPRVPPLSPTELREIRLVLTDEINDKIDLVADGDGILEVFALQQLVDETIRRQSPSKAEASLLERFDELSREEQERLQWLPADRILENLTKERR